MNTTLLSTSRYVLVSEKDANSSVYDLDINQTVIINGVENQAKNINFDDTIKFTMYSSFKRKNIEITFKVKYIRYSRFTSSCFSGDCYVHTIVGMIVVKDLKVGDLVVTPRGNICEIKCILKTNLSELVPMMFHPDGLIITGYHPVNIDSQWIFPAESKLFEKQFIHMDSVYSIGLDGESSFYVNGIEVIGLAHGLTDQLTDQLTNQLTNQVISHPYFGSNQVINDIYLLAPNGYCVIIPEQISRDPKTKLINGIIKL